MTILAHIATDGFRKDFAPLCGAKPTKWSADAVECPECQRLHAQRTAQPATQAEIDEAMREAGFEAAGNAGDAYNALRPVRNRY